MFFMFCIGNVIRFIGTMKKPWIGWRFDAHGLQQQIIYLYIEKNLS
jgi:hypothetical protein